MSAEIIKFPMENHPTGAREVLRDAMAAVSYHPHPELEIYDHMLSELWVRGFKVVPLDANEGAALSISGMDVVIDPSVPEGMILVKDARAKQTVVAMIFDKSRGAET